MHNVIIMFFSEFVLLELNRNSNQNEISLNNLNSEDPGVKRELNQTSVTKITVSLVFAATNYVHFLTKKCQSEYFQDTIIHLFVVNHYGKIRIEVEM